MNEIEAIGEPLRKALVAYYAAGFASATRVGVAHHVFGAAGVLLMPQLDELARSVQRDAKPGPQGSM